MVVNLLVGGHDTTSSQIGCTLLTLLVRPETLTEVRAEPALVPSLVSETMRFEPSIGAAPRTVAEPIEICGIERPAGTSLVCTFLAANRDPAVWHDPDAFVSRRFEDPEAPRLLSFGGGPHYCLGAALARMTIEEAVRGVAELAPVLAESSRQDRVVPGARPEPGQVPVTI